MIMSLLQKIRLSGRYGLAIYVISAIMTIAAGTLVALEPSFIPICILLKLFSIPLILYLFISMRRGDTIYYYINLGISRREYFALPVIVEFLGFVCVMVIASCIRYAI